MILTGKEIIKEYMSGSIVIEPFNKKNINPNSYNYHLGETIKVFDYFDGNRPVFSSLTLPQEGCVLKKGKMYLGCTKENIGSNKYVMLLIGRSSVGRLGLFLQLSASLGHTGTLHQRTLEIYPTHDVKIYPGMIIGQVSFRKNKGDILPYTGEYKKFSLPQESLLTY